MASPPTRRVGDAAKSPEIKMHYDPNGPTARAWDERNKLLALPRQHTPAERRRLNKLEAQLIKAGVLTISQDF